MAKKNYYGCCGSCKYLELGDSTKTLSGYRKFQCRRGHSYYADDKACNLYEPDRTRTNDMIEKYDRG